MLRAVDRITARLSVVLPTFVLMLVMIGFESNLAYSQNEAGAQRLGAGDKVLVTVVGQAEMSGEFFIEGTGALALPIVGSVIVRDLSLAAAEKRIAEKLKEVLQHPVVSLRLTESRPIYILGDVRNPGNYPFRYGATVLSTVAAAGGFGPRETMMIQGRSEFLLAEERLKLLQANQYALLVRLLRLQAQKNGSSELRLETDPRLPTSDQSLMRHVAQQQEILLEQKRGHEQTLNLMRGQKPRIDAEISATRVQAEAEEHQLKLLQEHIGQYTKLSESGLVRRYTMIELQREESRHKGNIARFAADIARLDLALVDLELRVQSTENAYQEKISTEMQEIRSRLQEVEITMPLAREVREAKLQQGGAAAALVAGDVQRLITIIRVQDGKSESFKATPTTTLVPGDIVDVQRLEPTDFSLLGSPTPTSHSAQVMR